MQYYLFDVSHTNKPLANLQEYLNRLQIQKSGGGQGFEFLEEPTVNYMGSNADSIDIGFRAQQLAELDNTIEVNR